MVDHVGTNYFDNFTLMKRSTAFININNISASLDFLITKYPPSLLVLIKPTKETIQQVLNLTGHVILVQGLGCDEMPPSVWGVGMYCEEEGGYVEVYRVGQNTVRNMLQGNNLAKVETERVIRRSDLMGIELVATARPFDIYVRDIIYGSKNEAQISGIFGDIFNIFKDKLNFTYSLVTPTDCKIGAKDPSRPSGWNGLVGMLSEGDADISFTPLVPSQDRAQVIDFTFGFQEVETKFYVRRGFDESNYTLFITLFTAETWAALVAMIFISGIFLYICINLAKDNMKNSFKLENCLTYSSSALTFVRRFTATPSTISGRIMFITILMSGLLVNGMWKASLTSALSVEKHHVLYQSLDDLVSAKVVPMVYSSSLQEAHFKFATSGPFKDAWELLMKNNQDAFWTELPTALDKISRLDNFALFHFSNIVERKEEYLSCRIEEIPRKYFTVQWAIPVKRGFEFVELLNIMIMRMRESGLQKDILNKYEVEQGLVMDCGKKKKGSALGMNTVFSAITIHVLGICIPIFILGGEIAYRYLVKRVERENLREQPH